MLLLQLAGREKWNYRRLVIELIGGPDHRVAEAIRGDGKLDRHERPPPPVEEAQGYRRDFHLTRSRHIGLVSENVIHNGIAADAAQKIVDDDPLVVPPDLPLRLLKEMFRLARVAIVFQFLDDLVVKAEEKQMELPNDHVLVVSGISG